METANYNPNNPAYEPTDESFNDLLMGAMATIYRSGAVVRDF